MNKLKRSFLWIKELVISLFKYWMNHPLQLPSIIIFLVRKIKYIPMFLDRNTATEHYSDEYEKLIEETVTLYKTKKFHTNKSISYKALSQVINNPYQILYFLVRIHKPKIIIETGVAAGKSTGFILQAIKDNKFGNLYSIDLPFQWYSYGRFKLHLDSLPPGKLPGYLIPEDLKKNWKLIIGDTYEELPKLLKKLNSIDMFFHDSEHTDKTMMFEYNEAWPRLNKKGILISDDIGFSQAFDKFVKVKQSKEKGIRSLKFSQLGLVFKSSV